MNFFGKSKRSPTPPKSSGGGRGSGGGLSDPGSALQKLKQQISTLEKRTEHLEKKSHACLVDAKRKSHAKNKAGAMQTLKRKKMYEKEINKLRTSVANFEQQAFAIENASTTQSIVEGMKAGKQAHEKIMASANIDKVEDLQDDISDLMAQANEVNKVISTPLGNDALDDDDLLAELDELDEFEGEAEDELEVQPQRQQAQPAANLSLPQVPTGPVAVQGEPVDEDEAELQALAAEMAMKRGEKKIQILVGNSA